MKSTKQLLTYWQIVLFILCTFGCNNNQNSSNSDSITNLHNEFQYYKQNYSVEDYNIFYVDDMGFISLPKFLTIQVGLINIIADNYIIEQVKRNVGSYYAIFKKENPIFVLTINKTLADESTFPEEQADFNFAEDKITEYDRINRKSTNDFLVINNFALDSWERTKFVKINQQNTIVSRYTYTKTNYPVFRAVSYKFLNNNIFYEIECVCLEVDFPVYNAIFEQISQSFLIKIFD